MSESDDIFSRWSKRKRAVREEEPPVAEVASEPEVENAEPDTPEEETELLARLNLPVPETMQAGDDFSVFMADHVPQFLRKRALKVLWRSNPVLANLDGLNDYDDDFNSPELTQKVLATGYQVGRGFIKRVVENAPEDEVPEEVTPEEDAPEIAVAEEAEAPVDAQENRYSAEASLDEDALSDDAPRPRRMRFET